MNIAYRKGEDNYGENGINHIKNEKLNSTH